MSTKKLSWWSSLKKGVTGLYLVTLAFVFIVAGVILLLLPSLKSTVWQTISGALLGAGFTILVTAITARQSSLEQYKKEANLQRKTDVYGPLHAELKMLRETLDKALAGTVPYPRWIEISGVERPSSLRFANTTMLPAFYCWSAFKARTQDFLRKLRKLYSVAAQVLTRLGAVAQGANRLQTFVYKQIWRGRSVERHAVAAQEIRHDKPNQSSAKLFAWLCQQEGRQAAA